jgi:Tol biopolymer transport system component/predicted Ser/Thr protein kinase
MLGKTLSHYHILENLGRGGMGEVYVAEDTKLSRQVALKVLPPDMAGSEESRQRFEREAKAIAALNHPNIVTVFSVEDAEGIHFITMELVRGKTLSELIPQRGFALTRFLEIAIPLADAVAAAHQQGITHRDLKPDNIMVSDEGRVKILDFGLAKLKPQVLPSSSDSSNLPTEHMTQEGRIMGTVAYMSPEQAEGKTVDHRSDIFSLGTLFYVMATGEKPFQGDSPGSILSSILRDTPTTVTGLNPQLPRELGRLVKRCLVKDPEHRYQSSKDLRNELEELRQEVASGEVFEGAGAAPSTGLSKRFLLAAVVAVAVLSVTATYLLLRSDREPPGTIEGTFTALTSQPGEELYPSLSPDGAFVVYMSRATGNWDLHLKRVGGEKVINLTEDSPEDDRQPAFSPDGQQIAFRSERQGGGIFVMGATGESVKRITDTGYNPAWSPDGKSLVYAEESFPDPLNRGPFSQLWAVDVASAEARLIKVVDAVQPSWSPSGHRIAFWGVPQGGQRDIWTVPAEGGEATRVTDDDAVDWNPVWSPDGRHLYFLSDRGGSMNLWRVPIDEISGKVLGDPEAVTTPSAYAAYLTISPTGRHIAYASAVGTENIQRLDFDASKELVVGPPTPVTRGSQRYGPPDPSPDGEWLACSSTGKQMDIFLMRTDGTGVRQLTNDVHKDRWPQWSPDGSRIAFYSDRSGTYEVWTIHPDGSGLERLTDAPEMEFLYTVWAPDGSRMAIQDVNTGANYIFDPNKPWKEQQPDALPAFGEEGDAFEGLTWSPDGSFLAGNFRTASGGPAGVATFSFESRTYQRLTDSGGPSEWLADSRRLLFEREGKIFILDTQSKKTRELFSSPDGGAYSPTLSKDNRTIYFTLATNEADIWLLTLN